MWGARLSDHRGETQPRDVSDAGQTCPEVHTQLHSPCSGTVLPHCSDERGWGFPCDKPCPLAGPQGWFSYTN